MISKIVSMGLLFCAPQAQLLGKGRAQSGSSTGTRKKKRSWATGWGRCDGRTFLEVVRWRERGYHWIPPAPANHGHDMPREDFVHATIATHNALAGSEGRQITKDSVLATKLWLAHEDMAMRRMMTKQEHRDNKPLVAACQARVELLKRIYDNLDGPRPNPLFRNVQFPEITPDDFPKENKVEPPRKQMSKETLELIKKRDVLFEELTKLKGLEKRTDINDAAIQSKERELREILTAIDFPSARNKPPALGSTILAKDEGILLDSETGYAISEPPTETLWDNSNLWRFYIVGSILLCIGAIVSAIFNRTSAIVMFALYVALMFAAVLRLIRPTDHRLTWNQQFSDYFGAVSSEEKPDDKNFEEFIEQQQSGEYLIEGLGGFFAGLTTASGMIAFWNPSDQAELLTASHWVFGASLTFAVGILAYQIFRKFRNRINLL